jgi:hypothetical protein
MCSASQSVVTSTAFAYPRAMVSEPTGRPEPVSKPVWPLASEAPASGRRISFSPELVAVPPAFPTGKLGGALQGQDDQDGQGNEEERLVSQDGHLLS